MFIQVIKNLTTWKNWCFQKELTINQINQECIICHYWYFKDIGYKFEQYACNKCHDISMMAYELKSIVILNVNDIDYRYVLWNITKNDANNRLNNSKLDD